MNIFLCYNDMKISVIFTSSECNYVQFYCSFQVIEIMNYFENLYHVST